MNKTGYEWQKNLINAAETADFRAEYKKTFAALSDDNTDETIERISVGCNYSVECRCLDRCFDNKVVSCSEWCLLDPDGTAVFTFFAPDCTLHTVIKADEKLYFFYNENLYGYNVLRLEDMSEFRYYPKAALPDNPDFEETFIWTDIYLNDKTRILAVNGCYWAGTFVVMLYHIPDVMKPFDALCFPSEFISLGYYDTDDKNPLFWDGTTLTVNCAEYSENDADYTNGTFSLTHRQITDNLHKIIIK